MSTTSQVQDGLMLIVMVLPVGSDPGVCRVTAPGLWGMTLPQVDKFLTFCR
jgi:hypothetical protein